MIRKENESLGKYTTVKIGGTARNFHIPESRSELVTLLSELKGHYYLLGGGSNLLINDSKIFEHIIYLGAVDKSIVHSGNGSVYAGCSVLLPVLIHAINDMGYGGIEEMVSIPGMVGGALYMNAGIGHKLENAIGNYCKSVICYHNETIIEIPQKDCGFERRKSSFQRNNMVILGANLHFKSIDKIEAQEKIRTRQDRVKKMFDYSGGNFGSVFSICNPRIMQLFSKLQVAGFKKKGVHFSQKTINWLVNNGGTYTEAIKLIRRAKIIHCILFQPCEIEIKIWE